VRVSVSESFYQKFCFILKAFMFPCLVHLLKFVYRHVNLNRRNFVFMYACNVRYMGCPKRSDQ
jgi:hypothetical protein